MRFSPDDVGRFAAWSGDHNPLHVDADFARQTYFGQPIVHGILTALASLASAGPGGSRPSFRSLELEFHAAAVPGRDYTLDTAEIADGLVITLRDDRQRILTIRAQAEASGGDGPASERASEMTSEMASEIASEMTAPRMPLDASTSALRQSPAPRTAGELSRGVVVTGVYPAGAAGNEWAGGLASETQARVLALCSYVTGMEAPGLRSLFTRVSVQFRGDEVDPGPLRFQARTVGFDTQFRMLETQVDVATISGTPIATATLNSYVPFSPLTVDVEQLRGQVAASAAALKDKVALVVGGTRGLGADLASALALAGCQVYASARHQDAASEELRRSITDRGGRLELLQGDAADVDWCQATSELLQSRHGHIDLLVLNACAPPSHLRLGRESLRRPDNYLRDNLALVETPLGTFLEPLDASHGSVVYISSSFVTESPAGFGHYVALKQSAEALVRMAVREHAGLSAVIARPPVLQTRWNDTPAAVTNTIPAPRAACHIVNRLARDLAGGSVELLTEFPAFAEQESIGPELSSRPAFSVRLAATFTTDALVPGVRFWLRELDIDGSVDVAPYGQVLQPLLDPSSLFAARTAGINVVLLRLRDWLRELPDEQASSLDAVRVHLQDTVSELERALRAHRARPTSETLLVLCPSFGGASSAENITLRQAETDLMSRLAGLPGLTTVAASDFHAHYGVNEDEISDPLRDEIAHIPYRDGYLHVLSAIVARHVYRRIAPLRKVVVVDCDNTLWRGVVGEVGAEGVELDAGHLFLHETLIRLSAAGVLVCLCSKNEEADVWRVFETRGDLRLRREHVVAAAINWLPKSQNLRSLAARLNLGIDSFIFIDDNPMECAEVRAGCPEVLTLQWPQEPERAVALVRHLWELDATGGTKEDQRRTQMYREEAQRQELRDGTLTFEDFIESLQLDVDVRSLSADDLRRAAQLTLRTNQFNFTTIRREESDVQALVDGGAHEIRTIRVRDRFGDYGLVGLLIVERGGPVWNLDTFLLSCRVLGRGVEHRILSDVGRMAASAGAEAVRVRIGFTRRNTPARLFLESVVPPELRALTADAIECELPASFLAAVRFEPGASGEAPVADLDSPPAAGSAVDAAAVRRRERQVGRAAFELATVQDLVAAIEGHAAPQPSQPLASEGIREAVYGAFAKALRMPVETVEQVDRLEALGCDSLRIVEITVALRQKFPQLPSTLLFEHRAVSKILAEIQALSAPEQTSEQSQVAGAHSAQAVSTTAAASTDIAVVGMDVRCAGASSPAELWDLLSAGRSGVQPVPPDRKYFLQRLNDTRPHWAGLLDQPARFDAEFFGVSPREADYMDPQLRLFLEVAWGAVEDAGYAGAGHDPDTGVFVGVMYGDYGLAANHGGSDSPYRCWEGFSLANRLSQLLDLRGPSIAVDTACSSSGTALHLACRALNAGDCRVAIVGGVNLILDPDRFASLGRLGILSVNGTCEPFGAQADGTVLGEGAGVVVLRPLQDAIERGDRIYGVIKGTGLSTGNGTVGFTAPNPQAQAEAIRSSIKAAGVDPRTVSYVETHGTGTALGDPIEVRGLTLAYTQPAFMDPALRVDHRCRIGSIKPNVGHLEAGAGLVGLIKVLLQLHHRTLVPSITSDAPNPQIPFEETPFSVQRTLEPWQPPTARVGGRDVTLPRRAGLSSFGVGGANAHVIVEEPPASRDRGRRSAERSAHVLALSGRTEEAIRRRAADLKRYIETNPGIDAADVAFATHVGRRHFTRRTAIAWHDREALLNRLHAVSRGEDARGVVAGSHSDVPRKVAFLFTGQGSQYAGMGKQLYETQPVFRSALDRCASLFTSLLSRPLLDLLFAEPGSPEAGLLNQTGFTQPALFAFEYALAGLWQSWGIRPDIVMGHSVGEIGALCVAGGVSLEDGLTLIAARGRLMQALPPGGTMTSVMADEHLVLNAISGWNDVAIAAVNAPRQVVISGAGVAVAEITARLTADGIKTKALTVSHAFHSPLMAPMLAEYERVVRTIRFTPPAVPLVSCVDGAIVTGQITRSEYWLRQVMDPVRFVDGMRVLESQGVRTYLEIGPQPVLIGMGRQCVTGESADLDWLPSLRPDADAWQTMTASLSELYAKGAPVDWKGFDAPYDRRRVSVPSYAFREKEHWLKGIGGGLNPGRVARSGPGEARTLDVDGMLRSGPGEADAIGPADLLYTLAWHRQPALKDALERARSYAWVIFADRAGVGVQLGRLLEEHGAAATLVAPGATYRQVGARAYEIDPAAGDDYARVWSAVTAGTDTGVRVVSLAGLDATAAADRPVEPLLHLVRAIVASGRGRTALWCVTQGAVAEDHSPAAPVALAQTTLWGFGRTAALEHPEIWGGLVDLPADDAAVDLRSLVNEIVAGGAEDQIALRPSGRYAPRLEGRSRGRSGGRSEGRSQDAANRVVAYPDAAYLITGGTGALGSHVLGWLVDRGARHILLASRSGAANAGALAAIRAAEQRGATVTIVAADVSRPDDVDTLLSVVRERGLPLRGIVHAAGTDSLVPLADLSAADVRAVMSSKVSGGWALHERSRDLPLDFFILFSSVASVLGSNGRAHYGAANAFLDGLAHERRRLGLPALAVNWGPWMGGGMASAEHLRGYERIGNHGLEPDIALRALDVLASEDGIQASVLDIDWSTFKPVYEARRQRPVVADLGDAPGDSDDELDQPSLASPAAAGVAPWVVRLGTVDPDERLKQLAVLLRAEVADTLGFDEVESVAPGVSFYDIGMDSLMMADLVSRLNKRLGISCSALVFDHPTVESLTPALYARIPAMESAPASAPLPPLASPESAGDATPAAPVPVGASGTSGYDAALEPQIFQFQTIAWPHRNPDLIPSRWRWMFVESARRLGREPIAWLHRDNGAIVGHMGAIPVRLKIGSSEREAAWCVDTMVLESHRSRAVGSRLMVDARETLPFALSLGQTSEMRQICLRLGWKQVAPLQVAQLVVRPGNVLKGKLPAPAAWAAGLGVRAGATARQLLQGALRLRSREIPRFDERHDRLWRASSPDIGCGVVRDASYLNWKYVDQPGQSFVRVEMLDGDELRGVAVWMLREADDAYKYRRAFLVDLVTPLGNTSLVEQVIRAAGTVPMERGADALICMHIGAPLTRALRGCGFSLRQPERFLLVDPGQTTGPALEQVLSADSWFVTQGDSDIDRPW